MLIDFLVQKICECSHETFTKMELELCSNESNCSRHCQQNGGEDGFICLNDLMMEGSDKKPTLVPFEVSKLTKKVAFMRSVVEQFWVQDLS